MKHVEGQPRTKGMPSWNLAAVLVLGAAVLAVSEQAFSGSLPDGEHQAISAAAIDRAALTTGILTGYLVYGGRYVPPPYKVSKVKVTPYYWEIRINGLTCGWAGVAPSPRTAPDTPGQFGRLRDVDVHCRKMWREGEAAGDGSEEIRGRIDTFVKSQKIVKEFRWEGKYLLHLRSVDGRSIAELVKVIHYPPGEQLACKLEIVACMRDLIRQLKERGKTFQEAKPVIIEALADQEFVGGSHDLEPAKRRENAARYYEKYLAFQARMDWQGDRRRKMTVDGVARNAEHVRFRLASFLEGRGLIFRPKLGISSDGTANEKTYERLQVLADIAESGASNDDKIRAIRSRLRHSVFEEWAEMLTANFRPTAEMEKRLAADMEWLRAKRRQEPSIP